MNKKKPLFDKPMEELREAFVRSRFGQDDVFGREDAEEWLRYQRDRADIPEKEVWRRFFKREALLDFISGAVITFLQRYATTLYDLRLPRHEPSGFSPLLPLVTKGLYWGTQDRGIYLHPDPVNTEAVYLVRGDTPKGKEDSLTFECFGECNRKTFSQTVLEIMLAEWWEGDPKMVQARECLCDAAKDEIRRERERAEKDFDEAVAVSADGKKIVHADYVVVIIERGPGPRNRSLIAFPATTFRKQKLIRSPEMRRTKPFKSVSDQTSADDDLTAIGKSLDYQDDWPSDEWRRMLGDIFPLFKDKCIQELRDYRQGGEHRILLTTPNFCLDPLPEGGEEIV